jgi:RNA polymerase sigma-70 factor (ECF subfamily)
MQTGTQETAGRFHRKTRLEKEARPGELARVIASAKAGDSEAIRYLYLRYKDNVYGYARSIVRDEHDAEDVTQQVFARLMTAISSYQQRSVPFTAWLLRITHNMAIDHIRRRRAIPCEEPHAGTRHFEDRGNEVSAALRQAIRELPDGQREVIVMRHVGGLSPAEIAERLDRSEDSIHGLHHRGRRALQQALVALDVAPVTAAA